MQAFNFKTDTPDTKPNHYLICPQAYCKAKPNQISPVFSMSMQQLENKWEQMIAKQPRVTLINKDANTHQYFYMQRSAVFKFPDFITVQFIPLTNNTSTIAMYSQAKYGYYDFDVNKKRLISWVNMLDGSRG